jgi:hypothetical protein
MQENMAGDKGVDRLLIEVKHGPTLVYRPRTPRVCRGCRPVRPQAPVKTVSTPV